MRTSTLLFFMILSGIQLVGQKVPNVTLEDLQQTVHPTDSTAAAAYLYHNGQVYYEIEGDNIKLNIEIHDRIKVYMDEGESFADIEIPLYTNRSNDVKLRSISVTTYNEENGKIVKDDLAKKNIYTEEANKYWNIKKMAAPNVKAGSIIDIKYKTVSPFIYTIPRWFFQKDVPIDNTNYLIRTPEIFTFTPIPTGFIPLTRDRKVYTSFGLSGIEYKFTGADVPAMPDDDFVLNIDDYRSSLKYEIFSAQFPGRTIEYFSKDWNEIAKTLSESDDFGREIKRRIGSLDEILLSCGNGTTAEKTSCIYNFVQQNYSWNKFYGIDNQEGLKKLIANKTGSVGDINLLLINLLTKLDVPVKPMILKSRYKGILNTAFPTITDVNYLLAAVELEGRTILLDASSKNIPLGLLPTRAINLNGVIINGKEGVVKNINNPNLHKEQVISQYELDVPNNTIKGKTTIKSSEYAGVSGRYEIEAMEKEEESDDEGKVKNKFELISKEGFDNIYETLVHQYDEALYSEMKAIDDKIFIDACLDFGLSDNPFIDEERKFPVHYRHRYDNKNIVAITIPEGYTLESAPDPVNLGMPGGSGSLLYEAKQVGDKIMISYNLKINTDIFLPDEYPALKQFYDLMFELSNQKIVLTK